MSLILRFYGLSGHSHFTFFKICFLKFLAAPHSTWELSSRTRDQTHIPCVGGQNLNHWSTREAPGKPTQKESLFTLSYDLFPFSFHLCSKNLSTGGIPTLFKKFILSKYSCIPKWFSYICIHTHTHECLGYNGQHVRGTLWGRGGFSDGLNSMNSLQLINRDIAIRWM